MKTVLTAIDVGKARKAGQTQIAVPKDALITPQAADDAREFGITLAREGSGANTLPARPALPAVGIALGTSLPPPASQKAASAVPVTAAMDALAAEVRRLVTERLGPTADPARLDAAIQAALGAGGMGSALESNAFVQRKGGIAHAKLGALPQASSMDASGPVRMTEAFLPEESGPGVGYMQWENTAFSWTFNHAEVLVVLEGELQLSQDGAVFTAVAGDALRIAAGSAVTLTAKGKVRCVNSSWPAVATGKA